MGSKRKNRRSISIRKTVYDRLMYYLNRGGQSAGRSASSVTETQLTALLDEAGVPREVPEHKTKKTRPTLEEARNHVAAHFTF